MRALFIIILIMMYCAIGQAQNTINKQVQPYKFDTILKSDYTIYFATDDSIEYLYLKKRGKIINKLSSMSKGLSYLNLGYVGADFKNYFVLVHSYGGGNPHWIEIFRKSTGRNILNNSGFWIGVDTTSKTLLYSKTSVPKPNDKMMLLDFNTMEQKNYLFPDEIFGAPEILNRIDLLNVTDTTFKIKYSFNNWKTKKYKTYNR